MDSTATLSAICANRSRRSRSGTKNKACPLLGVRVMLTRAPESGSDAADKLRALGAEVVEVPLIRIGPPPDERALAQAAARTDVDWIAFASVHGVDSFARRCENPRAVTARFAAVGPATSRAIASTFGRPADLMPESHTGGALGASLAQVLLPGERVLLVQALDARPEALETLAGAGCAVEAVAGYSTIEEPPADLAEKIRDVHVVIIASASAARGLRRGLGDAIDSALAGKTVVCIGPVTAGEAHHAGVPVSLVPQDYSMVGVIDALVEHVERR
jgi:uroporphyrinogen-III synthase